MPMLLCMTGKMPKAAKLASQLLTSGSITSKNAGSYFKILEAAMRKPSQAAQPDLALAYRELFAACSEHLTVGTSVTPSKPLMLPAPCTSGRRCEVLCLFHCAHPRPSRSPVLFVWQDLLPVKLKNQLQVWLLWADLNNSVMTTDDSFEVCHRWHARL